jgi:hypothetical protein
MKNDDIILLAIEHTINGLKFNEDGLLRFAKLVAQYERDACADLCKEMYLSGDMDTGLAEEAILARGDGITLTTIRHPKGKPALGDLNPESLEQVEIDVPVPVQVSPLEFVEMVMEKEHLVGNPIFWAEWPNKDKNT